MNSWKQLTRIVHEWRLQVAIQLSGKAGRLMHKIANLLKFLVELSSSACDSIETYRISKRHTLTRIFST